MPTQRTVPLLIVLLASGPDRLAAQTSPPPIPTNLDARPSSPAALPLSPGRLVVDMAYADTTTKGFDDVLVPTKDLYTTADGQAFAPGLFPNVAPGNGGVTLSWAGTAGASSHNAYRGPFSDGEASLR